MMYVLHFSIGWGHRLHKCLRQVWYFNPFLVRGCWAFAQSIHRAVALPRYLLVPFHCSVWKLKCDPGLHQHTQAEIRLPVVKNIFYDPEDYRLRKRGQTDTHYVLFYFRKSSPICGGLLPFVSAHSQKYQDSLTLTLLICLPMVSKALNNWLWDIVCSGVLHNWILYWKRWVNVGRILKRIMYFVIHFFEMARLV